MSCQKSRIYFSGKRWFARKVDWDKGKKWNFRENIRKMPNLPFNFDNFCIFSSKFHFLLLSQSTFFATHCLQTKNYRKTRKMPKKIVSKLSFFS